MIKISVSPKMPATTRSELFMQGKHTRAKLETEQLVSSNKQMKHTAANRRRNRISPEGHSRVFYVVGSRP